MTCFGSYLSEVYICKIGQSLISHFSHFHGFLLTSIQDLFLFHTIMYFLSFVIVLPFILLHFNPALWVYYVARAREDTEKIDRDVKRKAERLHHIATVCLSSHLYVHIYRPFFWLCFFLLNFIIGSCS